MKYEETIEDEIIFGFLKNILVKLFTIYSREFLDKAPNFSLRDFVPTLKKEMHEFEKSKDKKKVLKKFRTFSEKREVIDDLKQTFINKTIGILNKIKRFLWIKKLSIYL